MNGAAKGKAWISRGAVRKKVCDGRPSQVCGACIIAQQQPRQRREACGGAAELSLTRCMEAAAGAAAELCAQCTSASACGQ